MDVQLDVSYKIAQEEFECHQWEVQILSRRRVLHHKLLDEMRGQVLLAFNTEDSASNFSRRIPLRICLVQDEEEHTSVRLGMHLCGEDRPAFTVVEPGFHVIDAVQSASDEPIVEKLDVDVPVHLYLVGYDISDVTVEDGEGEAQDLVKTRIANIWRSSQKVDARTAPNRQFNASLYLRQLSIGTLIRSERSGVW